MRENVNMCFWSKVDVHICSVKGKLNQRKEGRKRSRERREPSQLWQQ